MVVFETDTVGVKNQPPVVRTVTSVAIGPLWLAGEVQSTCKGGNNATGDTVCGCEPDGKDMHLACPAPVGGQPQTKISTVVFASIGNPGGHCGAFTRGACDGSPAKAIAAVGAACMGKSSCTFPCDIGHENGGADPCPGKTKSVAVEVKCS